ncbi:MAG: pyridoxal phosphate-dependent aminotransferase [Chloroflexi bacterium]|jgi:aminotransferase|nr:pyridoxal phosphate-dependent aminotransferase [Chloroflexota bacterium]
MKRVLSEKVAGLKPSGIRLFFEIAATMKDVISLGIGEPDFATPEPIIQAGVEALRRGETHYTSNHGIHVLRQAIADHLKRLYHVEYFPQHEIIMTVGVSEALYLAFTAILNPDDEVIIPTPCFVSYQAEVVLAGGVPVEVATYVENNFVPKIEDIEAALTPKTRAILVGSPSNPTGAVYDREFLLQLADLAEKRDLIVISDEIYDRLVYGIEHVCFASLPRMQERTILLGGFSKAYAMTGWRIGFAAAPKEIINGMVRIHQYTVMSAPTISQYAALAALMIGEPYIQEMHKEYDRRRILVVKGLNSIGLRTFEPKGAFYAFPDLRSTGLSDDEFCNRLLQEEKVAVVPGNAFGDAGTGFARVSYATSYEQLEEALERIERFVKRI